MKKKSECNVRLLFFSISPCVRKKLPVAGSVDKGMQKA